MIERVRAVELRADRRTELARHARLALQAGRIGLDDPADVAALEACAAWEACVAWEACAAWMDMPPRPRR